MRADARRNYERLVTVAREAFAEHGDDASLDDIARRAGVGPGTLYRHFPNRLALQEAVYRDATEELCAQGRELAATAEPEPALHAWLALLVDYLATKRGMSRTLLETMGKESEIFVSAHRALHEVGGLLLDRAKAAGAVRPDQSLSDVLWLANGVALAADGPEGPKRAKRLLAVVLDGLRPNS